MTAEEGRQSATKADLAAFRSEILNRLDGYATKDSLKRFATKDDLKRFATKEDLKNFATKEDFNRLSMEIIKTRAHTDSLIASFRQEMDQKLDRILNAIDAFARKGESYDRTGVIHGHMLGMHDEKLQEHNQRITALESKS